MTGRLGVFACGNLEAEVRAILAEEAWPEVVVRTFPARCGRPPLRWEELETGGLDGVLLVGGACLRLLGAPPPGLAVRRVALDTCFGLVAGPVPVAEALAGGAYLVTPGWLAHWREELDRLGCAGPAGGELFREIARELVLFDTGVDGEAPARLAELGAALDLPVRRVAVGLDPLRLRLALALAEGRLEAARAEAEAAGARAEAADARAEAADAQAEAATRRSDEARADQAMVLDQLARLAQSREEGEVILAIEDLFRALFAPGAWHYLRVEPGLAAPAGDLPPDLLAAMRNLEGAYAWTPAEDGFLLRLGGPGAAVGVVAVARLAFPEHRRRYLNLALTLAGVCALAVEHARNLKRLVEAEKMASLGILVAGMAHELSTPVGVGRLAASALRSQRQGLAEAFAARTMTQTGLRTFLDEAETETRLLEDHFERIGRIIENFRQVAVDGRGQTRTRFRFRACLAEVLAGMGGLLDPGRVAVAVQCPEALELDSFPGDWAIILRNLVSNSVRHGFRDRARGRITVTVRQDGDRLRVDYEDDGAGLSTEAQARIFDPFFTTDRQQGMGLGMHLVFNLVTRRLGGRITCAADRKEGAHFQIEVPT